MPVLDGKLRNSSIAASNPPAEPPMPTIGQLEYCLADCNADFVLDDFNRDDFAPLVLIREGDALDIAFRFAAMRPFYVSLSLRITQATIVSGGTRCPQRVDKMIAALPPNICA